MGSLNEARMTGFICRLCSELNTDVIHIYSNKGKELMLPEKLSALPMSIHSQVNPEDSLSKTICGACIIQIETHYQIIENIKKKLFRRLLPAGPTSMQQQSNSTATAETQNTEDVTENCAVRSSNGNSK